MRVTFDCMDGAAIVSGLLRRNVDAWLEAGRTRHARSCPFSDHRTAAQGEWS